MPRSLGLSPRFNLRKFLNPQEIFQDKTAGAGKGLAHLGDAQLPGHRQIKPALKLFRPHPRPGSGAPPGPGGPASRPSPGGSKASGGLPASPPGKRACHLGFLVFLGRAGQGQVGAAPRRLSNCSRANWSWLSWVPPKPAPAPPGSKGAGATAPRERPRSSSPGKRCGQNPGPGFRASPGPGPRPPAPRDPAGRRF